MKLRLLLPAALLFALSANAEPEIKWLTPDLDFGAIAEADGVAQEELRFVNVGDTPVAVTAVHTSCGCTTANTPRHEIAPGDTASIAVKYDPTGRPGKFEKKVTVTFSDGLPKASMKVHGVVIGTNKTLQRRYPVDGGDLKFNTSVVPFGDVKKSGAKSDYIEIYNASRDTITPIWSHLPEYFSVAPMEGSVAPGQQIVYNLMFSGYRCPEYGLVTDSIFVASAPGETPTKIDIVGIVNEDFSKMTPGERQNAPVIAVDTDRLDFGSFDPSKKTSMSFNITNKGKNPLILRRVYTTDKGIEIDVDKDKVKTGKSASVKVTIDPSRLESDVLNSRISIISNDPDNSNLTIRLVGLPENF